VASYARGVLFATHSIGLARAIGQQVYALSRKSDGLAQIAPLNAVARLGEFLGELSFSGYRELGYKKVVLVEGPSDVTTIQQFLRMLHKDHLVLLLPLGGSSMINGERESELAEVRRISAHVYALIDSERTGPNAPLDPTRQAFVETCARLDIRCHVLKYR